MPYRLLGPEPALETWKPGLLTWWPRAIPPAWPASYSRHRPPLLFLVEGIKNRRSNRDGAMGIKRRALSGPRMPGA